MRRPTISAYPGAKNQKIGIATANLLWRKDMKEYWEVFGGCYGVGLKKPPYPENHYNDINHKLPVLMRVLSRREMAEQLFSRMLRQPFTEENFERAKQLCKNPLGKDVNREQEMQYATAVWVSLLLSMNGQMKAFQGIRTGREQIEFKRLVLNKRPIIELLSGLNVYNKDAFDLLRELKERPDAAQLMIYADPPYPTDIRSENIYECELSMRRQMELIDILADTPCKVILASRENPLYKEQLVRRGWRMIEVLEIANTMRIGGAGKWRSRAMEVVYMNYDYRTGAMLYGE